MITRFFLLDVKGIFSAIVLGAIVIFFSRGRWENFLLLLSFLILSVIVTKYRNKEKKELGIYEHERGWENVISNGLVPGLCVILFYFTGKIFPYICSISAVTADKFASEIGVLSGKPISLRNFKRVKQGTSGAISALGTYSSFIGALAIGVISYFLYKFDPFLIFSIALIGFVGSIFDTFAGIFEEKGIGNKATSNIICSLVGAVLAWLWLEYV